MSLNVIASWASKTPSGVAIIYNGQSVSYSAFTKAILGVLVELDKAELPNKGTVAVLVYNLRDCWVITLAIRALGLDTVCVNSSRLLEEIGIPDVHAVITSISDVKRGFVAPAGAIVIANPSFDADAMLSSPLCAQSGGHTLYTSGTTGHYKKLYWTGEQLVRCAEQRAKSPVYSSNPETVAYLHDFGLWTAVGFKYPLSVWLGGGSVILEQRPDWYRYFMDSGLTSTLMVPDMVNQLLDYQLTQAEPSKRGDFVLGVTSGFLSRKSAEQCLTHITTFLTVNYGATEINSSGMYSRVTDVDDMHWLEAKDPDRFEVVQQDGTVSEDEEGELRIHLGDYDCARYEDDPEASAKVFRNGYFYPGDRAVKRADGRIRVIGRNVDAINYNGHKYAAAPLEQDIQSLLGVSNVCILSGLDGRGEEEIIIAVEADRLPEKPKLDALARTMFNLSKVRYAQMARFPRIETGTSKINRRALRDMLFGHN